MAYFEVNKKPPLSFPTLTGSIVTFNSQYALPLYSHKIALTATQSGSGTPSPSNPRPISGYSAINISHSDADTSNPTVYIIQIGSTVYGGEYDARTGVLTVTSVKKVLRGSYFSSYSASIQCAVGGKPGDWLPWLKQTGGSCEMLSHGLPTTRSDIGNVSNGCFIGDFTGGNQEAMFIKFAGYSSLKDIQALIEAQYNSNTPVEVVYKLATPTTIQLPPCPIDTLQGVNNIWADTGDTTLQYPKFG